MNTSSEIWRAICEARAVARMTKEDRDAYYRLVMNRRGQDAQAKLVEAVNQERRKGISS